MSRQVHVGFGAALGSPPLCQAARASVSPPAGAQCHPWVLSWLLWGGLVAPHPNLAGLWVLALPLLVCFRGSGGARNPLPSTGVFWGALRPARASPHKRRVSLWGVPVSPLVMGQTDSASTPSFRSVASLFPLFGAPQHGFASPFAWLLIPAPPHPFPHGDPHSRMGFSSGLIWGWIWLESRRRTTSERPFGGRKRGV